MRAEVARERSLEVCVFGRESSVTYGHVTVEIEKEQERHDIEGIVLIPSSQSRDAMCESYCSGHL